MDFEQIFGKLVTDTHIELSEQNPEAVFLAIHNLDSIIAWHVLREVKKYFDFKLKVVELNVDDVFKIDESDKIGLPPVKQLNYTAEYYGLIGRQNNSKSILTNPNVMKAFSDFWSVLITEASGKDVYIFKPEFDIEEKEQFIKWLQCKRV